MIEHEYTEVVWTYHVSDWFKETVAQGFTWDDETELAESIEERVRNRVSDELVEKWQLDFAAMAAHAVEFIPVSIALTKVSEGYALGQKFTITEKQA